MSRRRWFTGITLLAKTSARTVDALKAYRLGPLIPFFFYMLLGAGLLWVVSAIAPLAPFVYSLF